MHISDMNQL